MGRGHRFAAAVRVALALLGSSVFAHGQALTERVKAGVHLSWVRSESAMECGNAGLVQADVVRRLGKNPFTEPSHVFVEATVSRSGSAFQALLDMRDEHGGALGSRSVKSDAATCDSLVSAAGFAIALMLDPDATLSPKEPASTSPVSPPPPTAPLRPPPAPPQFENSRSVVRGGLWAAAVGTSRMLPRAALGLRVGVEIWHVRHLGTELSLTFLPDVRQELRGFDVGFGLTYASGGICLQLLETRSVQLAGCTLGSIGAIHATTFEPARGRQGQLLWSAVGGGLRAAWVLTPPLLLRAGVEASVPIERRDYLIERANSPAVMVFSEPAFSATLHVGLGVRF